MKEFRDVSAHGLTDEWSLPTAVPRPEKGNVSKRYKLTLRHKIDLLLIPFIMLALVEFVVFGPLHPNHEFYSSQRAKRVLEMFCFSADYGWEITPNLKWTDDYGNIILCSNSEGYREFDEIDLEKKPDEIRVFVANDSIHFGEEVNQKDAICDLSETILSDETHSWEFINASVPCWGQSQTLHRIKTEAARFDPDLYMFSACQNDPGDVFMFQCAEKVNNPEMRERAKSMLLYGTPGSRNGFLRTLQETRNWLNQKSNFFGFLSWRSASTMGDTTPDWYKEMWNTVIGEGNYVNKLIPVYLDVFSQLFELTRGKCFVVLYPGHNYVGHKLGYLPHRDFIFFHDYPVYREIPFRNATIAHLEKHNIPYIDVVPIYLEYIYANPEVDWQDLFATKPDNNGGRIPDRIHPSALGHRLVAEELPAFLRQHFPELYDKF